MSGSESTRPYRKDAGANAYKAEKLEHVSDIIKEFKEELVWRQES